MANLFTNQVFMAAPFAFVDRLRADAPLVKVKLPIIGKVWVTTNQAALGAVLKDSKNFSLRKSDGGVSGTQWWMPKTITLLANNMLTMDEPDHTRLRSLVDKAFRRDFIMGLEPRIQQLADGYAANLFVDGNKANFLTAFARPLPLAVICEMLGIRDRDRNEFAQWAESLTTVNGMIGFLRAVRPIKKMRNYVAQEIERQRSAPGDGLIGQLVQMQAKGEPISDDEMVAMVFLLLIAGHETTTHVLTGGLFELLRHEDQRLWLMEDETHIALAVEEILRYVSAVQFTKPRNVRKDIVVEGVPLKKGDIVMAMIVAGNGDPDAIDHPHQFDLSRKPNRHVSFGAGPHFCLGHQLARLEIACALRAVLKAHPDLKLAGSPNDVQWQSRVGLRVIKALEVTTGTRSSS